MLSQAEMEIPWKESQHINVLQPKLLQGFQSTLCLKNINMNRPVAPTEMYLKGSFFQPYLHHQPLHQKS